MQTTCAKLASRASSSLIRANDATRKSWLPVAKNSDFSLQNLPFGIFSRKTGSAQKRVGVALGEHIIDVGALSDMGHLNALGIDRSVFTSDFLNPLIKCGKQATRELRNTISDLFVAENSSLSKDGTSKYLVPMNDAFLHLPVNVGDYTDFYSSEQHAVNVGTMFRDPANALLPNWKHLPVAYHGRASSIIASGVPIRRPKGQQNQDETKPPVFGPCRLLDFELEMAFITYDGKALGESISTEEAENFIFGFALFNDWSARDIQKWEYIPLGPFLSKNFASSLSPWIVTLDALEPFRVAGPKQDPKVLPYLEYSGDNHLDIKLEVDIVTESGMAKTVSKSNYRHMYWNMNQQLAHHTINGCNMRAGDLLASGTISGPTPDSYGSMLEISWRGTKALPMPDGTERRFILDGDSVVMRGFAEKDGLRVGFGEVNTKVLPASN